MLELAIKARRRGLSFEEFWEEARRPEKGVVMVNHPDPPEGAVLFPTDSADRQASLEALDATKDGWRRAYEGNPALPREEALWVMDPEERAARLAELARQMRRGGIPDGSAVA